MIKNFERFVNEKFDYTKQIIYTEFPETKDELKEIIDRTINEKGIKCNLNFIDTSKITDMGGLFADSKFNGDISQWKVSKDTYMSSMFVNSPLENNPPKWYHK